MSTQPQPKFALNEFRQSETETMGYVIVYRSHPRIILLIFGLFFHYFVIYYEHSQPLVLNPTAGEGCRGRDCRTT